MSPEEKRILQLSEENELLTQKYKALKEQLSQFESQKQLSCKRKVRWVVKIAGWWGGKDLKNSTIDLYNELPTPSKATTGNFLGSLADRFTKLTIFGLLLSLIPFILLLSQVVLLYIQNKKIESQNQKIEKQVFLEEASRRNNLVLLMDNILERVNDELKDGGGTLSDPLIGRISGLSQGFQPYYFLEDSTLTEKPFSPERGQLLLALANSGMDTTKTMKNIYAKTTFKQAYLKEAEMDSFFLKGADLQGADLKGANLNVAVLNRAKLSEADLKSVKLFATKLNGARLSEADLKGAKLWGTELNKANLDEADLRGAILWGVDLSNADLKGADLRGTELKGVKLSEANLSEADLEGAVGLTYKQLSIARSLYQTKGIPKEIKDSLLTLNPKLFENMLQRLDREFKEKHNM